MLALLLKATCISASLVYLMDYLPKCTSCRKTWLSKAVQLMLKFTYVLWGLCFTCKHFYLHSMNLVTEQWVSRGAPGLGQQQQAPGYLKQSESGQRIKTGIKQYICNIYVIYIYIYKKTNRQLIWLKHFSFQTARYTEKYMENTVSDVVSRDRDQIFSDWLQRTCYLFLKNHKIGG